MSKPLAIFGNGIAVARVFDEVRRWARPLRRGRARAKRRRRTSRGATMTGAVRI